MKTFIKKLKRWCLIWDEHQKNQSNPPRWLFWIMCYWQTFLVKGQYKFIFTILHYLKKKALWKNCSEYCLSNYIVVTSCIIICNDVYRVAPRVGSNFQEAKGFFTCGQHYCFRALRRSTFTLFKLWSLKKSVEEFVKYVVFNVRILVSLMVN